MRTLTTLSLLLLPLCAAAVPKEDMLQKQRVARSAAELFRAGSAASAVQYLRQNLRPETGPDGDTLALVQHLIEIAVSFYNRREMNLARETTSQALLAAAPILRGQSPASATRRADLCGSLGLLHETVMFDLKNARDLYDAAGALNPADELNRRRKNALVEKDKLHAGGGR